MASPKGKKFQYDTKFCGQCGALLPFPDLKLGQVECGTCKKKWIYREVQDQFVSSHRYEYSRLEHDQDEDDTNLAASAAGPTVNRKCTKCGNDTMSYATRQTRSADEGMTVFFTCTKCGHKDIEYT